MSKNAIKMVVDWADKTVSLHEEPTRAGTPHGDPVGISRKKLFAAIMMILHPKFTLKDLAAVAEVKSGVLRVWRTQDEFKRLCISMAKLFGKNLAETYCQVIGNEDQSTHMIYETLALVNGQATEAFYFHIGKSEKNKDLGRAKKICAMVDFFKYLFTQEGILAEYFKEPIIQEVHKARSKAYYEIIVDEENSKELRHMAAQAQKNLNDLLFKALQ